MSNLIELTSELQDVVRLSLKSIAHKCKGKDQCTDPACIYQGVQRHQDPRSNPYLDMCYTSTMTLFKLMEKHLPISSEEMNHRVQVFRKDGPTGRKNSKGPIKHFWLELDGHVFDPSYLQYVIGKTALPTYDGGELRKFHKETIRRPHMVLPLLNHCLSSLN